LRALKAGWASAGDISQIISRMGPEGKEMVPHLISFLKQNERDEATISLGQSEEAIIALGQIGPAAKGAIPLLKDRIKKYDQDEYAYRSFQLTVAYSLWQIDHQQNEVFALLRAAIKSNGGEYAVEIISKIGPPAKEFVPFLVAEASDPSPLVYTAPLEALEKVDPEAAAKVKKQRKLRDKSK